MSREKDKKKSLDALAKFAYAVGGGAPAPKAPPAAPKSSLPKPAPKPAPPAPAKPVDATAARARKLQMEDRKAKLDEERALKQRRANELARGSHTQWRGMWTGGAMPGVRRTAFEKEPSLAEKIHGVLGDAAEKEGRAKARDKGKRAGGK